MIDVSIHIRSKDATVNVGTLHTNRWPVEDDVIEIGWTEHNNSKRTSEGPRFRVVECDKDERTATVVRHIE